MLLIDLDVFAFDIFIQHDDKKKGENSRRIDLLEDRTTQDQLMGWDIDTSLELRHEA